MDYNERVYCRQRHLSEKALRKSWSSSHQETLIKQIVEVLQISGVGPLGLSQQFETQRDSSWMFINTLQCPLLKQGESPPMQMHPGAGRGDT